VSYHEYVVSKGISQGDRPFYALVMAAMRQADTNNAAKLRAAFPDTWAELDARYNAPGGILDGET
jgi:hypothetical protein